MKRHVICLGDSNTHGYCGAQEGETLCGGRFSEAERWPCLLQRALGEEYLVIEEGLCGRTTVFPDPLEPGLDAISYLRPCLLSHAPVSLLILMLESVLATVICSFAATPFLGISGATALVPMLLSVLCGRPGRPCQRTAGDPGDPTC